MTEQGGTVDADEDLVRLGRLRTAARELADTYPENYRNDDLTPAQRVELAAEGMLRRGIASAADVAWVARHADPVTLRVTARESLFHRLVKQLQDRDDIGRAVAFARSRGLRETEAYDVVEDAIMTLLRRGLATRPQDMLLRAFRTILWELISDAHEKASRQRALAAAALRDVSAAPAAVRSMTPARASAAAEGRAVLRSRIRGADLGIRQKAALLLKHAAGWTSQSIGELLGVAPGQVDVMNHRSRAALRASCPELADLAGDIAGPATDGSAAIEALAARLPAMPERAGLLLHGLFDLPAGDVASFCGVTEARLAHLVATASSEGPEAPSL
jgi:RNA polymerase sigma factor (sigma-70 family)